MTNILVTQPRRISALSVATRVAEERGEIIGEKSRQVILKIQQNNQKSVITNLNSDCECDLYIF